LPAPTWLAATTGYPGEAGQVNQFLAAHAVTYLYQGALTVSQATPGGTGAQSGTAWYAQSFTAPLGQTQSGYVEAYAFVTGSPPPWPLTLQTDNGSGAPSGTVLSQAALPKEFASGSYGWIPVPLPFTGLVAGTRYWIVAQEAGDSGDYFSWHQSNQSSGASSSPDGVTWTASSYGLMYQAFDQSPLLPLAGTWEDSGARWTWLTYTAGLLTGSQEYTAGQSANGYAVARRTLSYSGPLLTGVA
jgi:hypothetical protein